MSPQIPVLEPKNPVPPEERFWKRYSPHHEFPLSSVGSVVLHVLSVGALLVLGYVLTRTAGDEPTAPPLIDVIASPNLPKGGDGPGGKGADRDPLPRDITDVAKDPDPPQPGIKSPEAVKLKDVVIPRIRIQTSPDGARTVVGTDQEVFGDLDTLIERTREHLNKTNAPAPAPKGAKPGGPPGRPPATLRQKRQERWKMFFPTTGGDDYLNQLRGLGAILAVPRLKGNGQVEYLVIRDLGKDAVGTREDVNKLNRIFWIDNEPRSVLTVAKALGLRNPPPFFVAFFPRKLEDRLRELEKQAYSGDEDRIVETRFRVVHEGGVYQAELDRENPVVLKRN